MLLRPSLFAAEQMDEIREGRFVLLTGPDRYQPKGYYVSFGFAEPLLGEGMSRSR
jgi:hypothetical protein